MIEINVQCARCSSELDAVLINGILEVEPCDCGRLERITVGPDADEAMSLRVAWEHRA